jgi:hypothetical protein
VSADEKVIAFPRARGGEFFAIDKAPFEAACKLGLNPAVAYLTVARGAGRDNAASFWSVNAIEEYSGISRPKANAAVQSLIDNGLLSKERGGKRPRYRINRSDEPQWIWLPNAVVDGAANEEPPLRLLRQMQDVRRLRLFVAMYDSHDLANNGGISRAVLWQQHTLTKEGERGASTIWAFDPHGTSYVHTRSSLAGIYVSPNATGEAKDGAFREFWDALRAFQSLKLVEFVPHIFESDKPEAELIHACALDAGEPWEKELATAAHQAGFLCLSPGQQQWTRQQGRLLIPMPSHIDKLAVIGIARLKYRPRTKMTAAWFAMSKEQAEAFIPIYQEISRNAVPSASDTGTDS